jgi:hypothetical protein
MASSWPPWWVCLTQAPETVSSCNMGTVTAFKVLAILCLYVVERGFKHCVYVVWGLFKWNPFAASRCRWSSVEEQSAGESVRCLSRHPRTGFIWTICFMIRAMLSSCNVKHELFFNLSCDYCYLWTCLIFLHLNESFSLRFCNADELTLQL